MIRFENQPKLSEYSVDQEYNERREALVLEVEKFLTTNPFFTDKEVTSVRFSHEGVSSLVAFITTKAAAYVLKVPLAKTAEGEAEFLKAWEKVGVPVPHVFQQGKIGELQYILMSFVDAPQVKEVLRSQDRDKVLFEAGATLSKMHKANAHGYGRVINGGAEFNTFTEWISSGDITKRVGSVRDDNLLTEEHGSVSEAVQTLIAYNENNPESVYCHFDFGLDNLMATEPPTVIDPSPMFNNPIMDIGRSMVIEISRGGSGQALLDGYCSDGRVLNQKALRAAILINAYWKFNYWGKKDYKNKMDNVRGYLSKPVS